MLTYRPMCQKAQQYSTQTLRPLLNPLTSPLTTSCLTILCGPLVVQGTLQMLFYSNHFPITPQHFLFHPVPITAG